METPWSLGLLLVAVGVVNGIQKTTDGVVNSIQNTPEPHGGVPMGNPDALCDNAQWKVELDWDAGKNYEYTCQADEMLPGPPKDPVDPVEDCLESSKILRPVHRCMTFAINYTDHPPRSGPHRPLWPVYGEYVFVPPQRWMHSLEHGAAVFLYHPCADTDEVEVFKKIARSCLRKHIISPSRELPKDKPFGVLTYGCRILMPEANAEVIIDYVRKRALQAPEGSGVEGQYSLGLLYKADLISDMVDSGTICPISASTFRKRPKNYGKLKHRIDTLEVLMLEHPVWKWNVT